MTRPIARPRVRLDSLPPGAWFTCEDAIGASGRMRGQVIGPGVREGVQVQVRLSSQRQLLVAEWGPGIMVQPDPDGETSS